MKNLAVAVILTIFTVPNLYAQWSTSGSNIYNSNTGNVGIGITTPSTTLHVNGAVTAGRLGYYGTYNSSQIQGIWSIGPSYQVDITNNNFGTQYGMGYAFSTNGGASFANQHQIVFTNNGAINGTISLSGNVKFIGTGEFGGNGSFGGNVGIGTPTPLSKLHIEEHATRTTFTGTGIGTAIIRNEAGTSNYSILDFSGGSSNLNAQSRIASLQTASGSLLQFGTSSNYASGITNTAMTIDYAGKVGIGTVTPTSLFDVFGQTAGGNVDINFRNQPGVNTAGTRTNMNFPVFNGATGLQISEMTASTGGFNVGNYDALISTGQSGSYLHLAAGSAHTPQVTIKFTGDVGIGITNPKAKLDVNGNIYANGKIYIGVSDANTSSNMGSNMLAVNGSALFNKVTVKMPLWPDYVFSPTYKLTPLDSLEQFIQIHKHLPEVPSVQDVQKDGIDLGDNQALLLKKIEELTLIIIEQNKRIDGLESKVKLLSN